MAEVKKQKKMPRKKATKRQKMDWFAAYVFIAPVTIGLFAFYIWPFFQNLWFSFNDVNKFNVSHFVGLENYKNILTDMTIWRSFGNTLKYVVITVPVGLFFSIVLAALLNAGIKENLCTVPCISCPPLPCPQRLQWYGNGYSTNRWAS